MDTRVCVCVSLLDVVELLIYSEFILQQHNNDSKYSFRQEGEGCCSESGTTGIHPKHNFLDGNAPQSTDEQTGSDQQV